MCHDFHVLGRVATMDTATQHSKLSYQNYLEYTISYERCSGFYSNPENPT